MKFAFSRICCIAALFSALFASAVAHAESYSPVAVVSLPSYDKLVADVDFIGKLTGQPGLSQQMDGMIRVFTQGQGLKGLDKSKPWGVAVTIENSSPVPMAFLPVTSAKDLVDVLAGIVGPSEEEDGAIKVSPPHGPAMYVREKNGWAFVSQSKDSPLPDDPMKLLDNLNTQYDVAARIYFQNISEETKQQWLGMIKNFMQMAAQMQQARQPGMEELTRKNMEAQIKQLEQLFNDADQITFGWKLDTQAKNTDFDTSITAKPGTNLGSQMQTLNDTKSDFTGFLLPDAGVTLSFAGKIPPENIDQAINAVDQVQQKAEESLAENNDLSDEARNQVKGLLQKLIDVAKDTIKSGKYDHGSAVTFTGGKLQVVAGSYVADGPALESAVKELINWVMNEPNFEQHATVKFDLETYKDIHLHELRIALPENSDEHARKILGDALEVYFGAGPKSAYLAIGQGSLDQLKSAIDKSEPNKSVMPAQLTVALASIADFAAGVKDDDSKLKAFAEALDKHKGKDHLLLTVKPISNGELIRVHVEEGVLEAVGDLSKMRQNRRGAGGMQMQPGMPGAPGG